MSSMIATYLAQVEALYGQGRLVEAENLLRNVASLAPGDWQIARALGVVAADLGRHGDAVIHLSAAAARRPRDGDLQFRLGNALAALGRNEEAEAALRKAARLIPNGITNARLGRFLRQVGKGKDKDAIQAFRAAIRFSPEIDDIRNDLALALIGAGQFAEAEAVLKAMLARSPQIPEGHNNLGLAVMHQQRYDEAIRHYSEALRQKPDFSDAMNNLCLLHMLTGDAVAAEKAARAAVAADPLHLDVRGNLLILLVRQKNFTEAMNQGRQMVALHPQDANAYTSVSSVYISLGRQGACLKATERAALLAPHEMQYRLSVASLLQQSGRADEAIPEYREILERPDMRSADAGPYLFSLGYTAWGTPEALQAEAERICDQRLPRPSMKATSFNRDRSPGRRLKIGYVSHDFCAHAVSYFIQPLLRHHDRDQVQVSLYSTHDRPDAVTAAIQQLADRWVDVSALTKPQITSRIRADDIDILIDLAGHTAGHSLAVFAERAAPVQATYLGYFATTGLREMDYWITDRILHPDDSPETTTEAKWRLDRCWVTYDPAPSSPAVRPRPARPDQGITFGSFNSLAKLTPQSIALWSATMRAIPTSRLLLKAMNLNDAADQATLAAAFANHGITRDRLTFLNSTNSFADHLDLYGEIDIVLDPLPCTGGTTTADALWMGAPVLTLAGSRMIGRMSASMLDSVGLQDWITQSADDFVARAVQLAQAHDYRADLRHRQRDMMARAALTDGASLARGMEQAYRGMWQNWLARSQPR